MGFSVDVPEDLLQGLLGTDFMDIAKEMEESVGQEVKSSMQKSLKTSVKHSGDSALVNSIKVSKPKKAKTGAVIMNIGPSGKSAYHYVDDKKRKRSYPVSNALKGIWLQYGTKDSAAKPWLDTAVNDVEQKVIDKMEEIYHRTVDK